MRGNIRAVTLLVGSDIVIIVPHYMEKNLFPHIIVNYVANADGVDLRFLNKT